MKKPRRQPTTGQDRMHFLNQITCNAQINCVIELDGHIDVDRFTRAVQQTMETQPILSYRFAERSWRPFWELRPDHAQLTFFDMVTTDHAHNEVVRFLGAPLNPEIDQLFRWRLIREGNHDTLCAKISHVVSDLGGLKECVYHTWETYASLSIPPGETSPAAPVSETKPVPSPVSVSLSGRRSFWQLFRNQSLRQKMKLLRRGRRDFIKQETWEIPLSGDPTADAAFEFHTIKGDDFTAIYAAARTLRATLNEMVFTAYFRALCRWTGVADGSHLPLLNTIDLRHYLPGRRAASVCNLATPIFPVFQYVAGESFEDTLTRVKAEMKQQKRASPGIMPAVVIELLFGLPFAIMRKLFGGALKTSRKKGKSIPSLTDGGMLALKVPGASVRNIIGIPPVVYPPNLMLAIGCYGESMTWTIAHWKSEESSRAIGDLYAAMTRDLLNAATAKPDSHPVTGNASATPANPVSDNNVNIVSDAPGIAGLETPAITPESVHESAGLR